jgi:dTMP kinase
MTSSGTERRGLFLVFEGIDGAGTTSQQAWLCQHLIERGFQVHKTAEPTSNPVGRLIREVLRGHHAPFSPHALALLFAADRADHLAREIEPALAEGKIVVCDRYILSSLAYQTVAGVPKAIVAEANATFRIPDLTVYFDLPVEVAAQRRAKRAQAQEIFEVDDFQRGVASLYQSQARAWQELGRPVRFLDAAQTFESVSAQLVALVLPAVANR